MEHIKYSELKYSLRKFKKLEEALTWSREIKRHEDARKIEDKLVELELEIYKAKQLAEIAMKCT